MLVMVLRIDLRFAEVILILKEISSISIEIELEIDNKKYINNDKSCVYVDTEQGYSLN